MHGMSRLTFALQDAPVEERRAAIRMMKSTLERDQLLIRIAHIQEVLSYDARKMGMSPKQAQSVVGRIGGPVGFNPEEDA